MIYDSYPARVEIFDTETKDTVAIVECFDVAAANIKITQCHNRRSFDLLVPHIQRALSDMKLEGDV